MSTPPDSNKPPAFSRRGFIKTVAGAALGLNSGVLSGQTDNKAESPGIHPNILWITMEDTSSCFIGCYGNKDTHTPNMDRLAREGVRFTRAFSTAPVCSPSRSTIITGCLAERLGTGNHRSRIDIPGYIKGFPYYLKQRGYFTSNNLKTDYNVNREGHFVAEAWDACYGAGGWATSFMPSAETWAENAAEAGWWQRKPGQPFFSVFNLMTSHQSRTMSNPHEWYLSNVRAKLPPALQTNPANISIPPFYLDTPEMRAQLGRAYDAINLADIQTGRILDRLQTDGLAEDTIVFCFADHGEGLPRGKTSALSLGFNIPFFVFFPPKWQHLSPWRIGQPTSELISSSEDVAPTVLSLAGAHIPKYMTGQAFLGGERGAPRKYAWGARNRIDESPDLSRTVTDGRFFYNRVYMPQLPLMKYYKYSEVADITRIIRADYEAGRLGSEQSSYLKPAQPVEYLYDLDKDPWELDNLAGEGGFRSKLSEMRGALESHLLLAKDIHFMPEYEIMQRIHTSVPYNFRLDPAAYPLPRILQAANLIGSPDDQISKQIDFLRDNDAIVRYWAAVGLDARGISVKPFSRDILAGLDDAHPCVRIVMAGIAFKVFQDPKGQKVLQDFAVNENEHLALLALQTIQYMLDKARPFAPTLHDILQRLNGERVPGDEAGSTAKRPGHIAAISEVTLHFLEGAPIFYREFINQIPPSQLKPDPGVHFVT